MSTTFFYNGIYKYVTRETDHGTTTYGFTWSGRDRLKLDASGISIYFTNLNDGVVLHCEIGEERFSKAVNMMSLNDHKLIGELFGKLSDDITECELRYLAKTYPITRTKRSS